MPGAKARISAEVVDVRSLSPHVRAVELGLVSPFDWSAGQYVAVSGSEEGLGARYYSLASMPSARGTVELCVGDSEDAPAFPRGGRVWLSGPHGRAAVPAPTSSLVLVGMGTGVAPLRAVLFEQQMQVPAPSVTLLVGFRSEEDVLYDEEFEQRRELGQLDYRPVLSQPRESWRGRRGYVQAHLTDVPLADRYCVCGKLGMVQEVQGILEQADIPAAHVFAEGY